MLGDVYGQENTVRVQIEWKEFLWLYVRGRLVAQSMQRPAERALPQTPSSSTPPHASQPDSAVLVQLQAQVNVLAAQLEAVGKQLALASQVAINEQSRAQVQLQPATVAPAKTCMAGPDLQDVRCIGQGVEPARDQTPAALLMHGSSFSSQALCLCIKCWHHWKVLAAVQSAQAEARASADTAAGLQEQLEHVKIRLQEAHAAKVSTAPPSGEVSGATDNTASSTKAVRNCQLTFTSAP